MAIDIEIIESEPFDGCFTDDERTKLEDIVATILEEYAFAATKFGTFNSGHEGIAIIQEEFEELKKSVFWPEPDRDPTMEAKQVAAMAIRFLVDISYA